MKNHISTGRRIDINNVFSNNRLSLGDSFEGGESLTLGVDFKKEKVNKSSLIEIHNRPNYLKYLISNLNKRTYALYFHNDPLTMTGSKSIDDRIFLLKNCFKIIFNSN